MRTSIIELDITSRIILIILIVIISYLILMTLLRSFFYPQPQSMYEMMQQIMGGGQFSNTMNLIALLFSVGIGFLFSILIRTKPTKEVDEFKILKKALSEDENKIMSEIKRTGEITQDSLRFRLGWSKAKVSTILTNLDKMNLIQRERMGKTYKVFIQKKRFKTV